MLKILRNSKGLVTLPLILITLALLAVVVATTTGQISNLFRLQFSGEGKRETNLFLNAKLAQLPLVCRASGFVPADGSLGIGPGGNRLTRLYYREGGNEIDLLRLQDSLDLPSSKVREISLWIDSANASGKHPARIQVKYENASGSSGLSNLFEMEMTLASTSPLVVESCLDQKLSDETESEDSKKSICTQLGDGWIWQPAAGGQATGSCRYNGKLDEVRGSCPDNEYVSGILRQGRTQLVVDCRPFRGGPLAPGQIGMASPRCGLGAAILPRGQVCFSEWSRNDCQIDPSLAAQGCAIVQCNRRGGTDDGLMSCSTMGFNPDTAVIYDLNPFCPANQGGQGDLQGLTFAPTCTYQTNVTTQVCTPIPGRNAQSCVPAAGQPPPPQPGCTYVRTDVLTAQRGRPFSATAIFQCPNSRSETQIEVAHPAGGTAG